MYKTLPPRASHLPHPTTVGYHRAPEYQAGLPVLYSGFPLAISFTLNSVCMGFLCGSAVKSLLKCRRCRRCRFTPCVEKIPWSRKWQTTPVFLLGILHDRGAWRASVHGIIESDMTECLSMHTVYVCQCYFRHLSHPLLPQLCPPGHTMSASSILPCK